MLKAIQTHRISHFSTWSPYTAKSYSGFPPPTTTSMWNRSSSCSPKAMSLFKLSSLPEIPDFLARVSKSYSPIKNKLKPHIVHKISLRRISTQWSLPSLNICGTHNLKHTAEHTLVSLGLYLTISLITTKRFQAPQRQGRATEEGFLSHFFYI